MSVQEMILDIQKQLRQLSSDEISVIWRLVQMIDAAKQNTDTPTATNTPEPREWFDVEEFLAWRHTQRDADLLLEHQRNIQQEKLWV